MWRSKSNRHSRGVKTWRHYYVFNWRWRHYYVFNWRWRHYYLFNRRWRHISTPFTPRLPLTGVYPRESYPGILTCYTGAGDALLSSVQEILPAIKYHNFVFQLTKRSPRLAFLVFLGPDMKRNMFYLYIDNWHIKHGLLSRITRVLYWWISPAISPRYSQIGQQKSTPSTAIKQAW